MNLQCPFLVSRLVGMCWEGDASLRHRSWIHEFSLTQSAHLQLAGPDSWHSGLHRTIEEKTHSRVNLGFSGGGWISLCRTEFQSALHKSQYSYTKGTFSKSVS